MNILLVTPFQLQDIGGVSVIVKMLYREWTKRGHPVDMLVPGDSLRVRPVKDAPDAPLYAACLRLPYVRQAPLRGFLSFWLHLPLTLYALHRFLTRRRIAAVVIQYPLPWVFYFALLRPFARWKLVAVLQGSEVHQIVSLSWVDRLLVRWVLMASDRVVAASHSLLQELREKLPRLRLQKTAVVPNGAPIGVYTEFTNGNRLPIPTDYILTVGQVIHRKGIDVLLCALQRARDCGHIMNLVVVGDGPERARLQEMARATGLDSHVYFIGNQPHARVMEYIRGCSFFVLASRAEGLPLVVLEAMAFGKAVIATEVDGIPEVIRDGYTGLLVAPDDALSLAKGIIRLQTTPALREQLATRGQAQTLHAYSWGSIAQQYLKIFAELTCC